VLSKVPQVDPNRLYAAGHSSAGTMALDLAAADSRIRAVAAYAPATDVVAYWGNHLDDLNRAVPGSAALASRVSPIKHVSQFNCPVFIFHAADDRTVPTGEVQRFVDEMESAGKTIEFRRAPSGGHYNSMIREGIPQGISFFLQNGAMEPGGR
ncbi:MAG TPA: prolyl oligopeptidase family serine peptidase, partial [Tepidisphaeraceae bacterium]|nr:prolyl oligopeptidase family serine peptidase [Tepidisphaeraceae bacterium]